MRARHQKKLRELIESDELVVVIGSGVSKAVCPEAPMWPDLIERGLTACEEHGSSESWCKLRREALKAKDDPEGFLFAAESVQKQLMQPDEGRFKGWLNDTFGDLNPSHPEIVKTLASWQMPLLTTNYDGLIESVTGYGHVTWRDPHGSVEVLRGVKRDRRVLHLHGFCRDWESIVLGVRSYEAAKADEFLQTVQKALAVMKSILFVGCGADGMSDPNIGRFIQWLKQFKGVDHYWLLCEKEMKAPDGHLIPVNYGKEHKDLPTFLAGIMANTKPSPPIKPSLSSPQLVSTTLTGLPPSVLAYLERLERETACLELMGLGRSLQVNLPIADAYVPLQTILAPSIDEKKQERFHGGQQKVSLNEIFLATAKMKQRAVILLGEPGAGKTTGARQLAWRLASRQSLPEDLGLPANTTPVLLRFRQMNPELFDLSTGQLHRFLQESTHAPNAPAGEQDPSEELWNSSDRNLLWILDGLDEVVKADQRGTVSTWIQQTMRDRPKDWFLVTCRFQGYFRDGVPLGGDFAMFHVRPLDESQARQFVLDWFRSIFGRLILDPNEAASKAQAKSDGLLAILFGERRIDGHLAELSTNPLLLTILCVVYHDHEELPEGRAELYQHCVMVMLAYWRRERYGDKGGKQVASYDPEAARTVLARLAWWMHEKENRVDAPLDELEAEAEKALSRVTAGAGLGREGKAFIARMREEAGVLAMTSSGKCGFLHLSFQEYLASEHAVHAGESAFLASQAHQSWWQEVALLSLRQSEPYCGGYFRDMLLGGMPDTHFELALRCLNEARYFAAEPFVSFLADESIPLTRRGVVARLVKGQIKAYPELLDVIRSIDPASNALVRSIIDEISDESVHGTSDAPNVILDQRADLAFVRIPSGEFRMGSENGYDSEQPIHEVRISEDFELSRYPVTNTQFRAFLEQTGSRIKPEQFDDRRFNQPEQPVVGISWDEAKAFCEWVGGALPTEAQWEYACRAGTTGDFSFEGGEERLAEFGWYTNNSGGQTQPVGQKEPNAWGLYDMHGNVDEWCADWYDKYSDDRVTDPQGPESGTDRVIRGGSWDLSAEDCRSACRFWGRPSGRSSSVGFRVARSSTR